MSLLLQKVLNLTICYDYIVNKDVLTSMSFLFLKRKVGSCATNRTTSRVNKIFYRHWMRIEYQLFQMNVDLPVNAYC